MTIPGELSAAARALLSQRAGLRKRSGPTPRAHATPARLSTPQLGHWLVGEVHAASGAPEGMPKTLRLQGRLNRDALRRALTELTRRHDVLRSVITVHDGEPIQTVTPARLVELREVDLRSHPAAEGRAAAMAVLDEAARLPFDLGSDLLIRPLLVQVGDQEFELQVTFHHVVFDGWSNGIFLREIGALYSAFAAGRPSPLPELPLQYADFAEWERAREGSAEFEADRMFWKERLAGSTTILDLPTDRPRQRSRGLAVASARRVMSRALVGRLSSLALEEGTTLFAVAFAAFQVLVGRRAGRHDFVLGAVSANRTQPETENLIGSFMTVLPLRARLAGAPTFRAHLRCTAQALAEGIEHQAFPFTRLLSELRHGEATGIETLYQVIFNYRSMPVSLPLMAGIEVSDFRAPHLRTTVDLHLNATPRDGELLLQLDYDPDLFRPATAERWLDGYRAMLESVAARPDAGIADLAVMPESERLLLASEWSGAGTPSPTTDLVIARLEKLAASHPDFTAVDDGGVSVSYRELLARMERLAAHLHGAGAARGDLIGVASKRSADTVAAALAILSIGAVYVPLDPATPRRRLDAMLETAGVKLILTDRGAAGLLSKRAEPTLCIADLLASDPEALSVPRFGIGADDPAYVIFTSGSTGVPKGVVIPHGALARYTASSAALQDVRAGDRMLHFATLIFDTSIKEIFVPLGIGGTIVVPPESMVDTPAIFAEQCRILRLTHMSLPTAFWNEVITAEWPGGMDLGAMRVVAVGGEAMTPDSVRRFFAVARPGMRLVNGYGPTETTVAATLAELTPGEEFPGEVPIGRPYPGVTVRVLDEHRQRVPIGAPGELWIGGGNVGLGYLGAPELTAARFVSDPTALVPGQRLYRTGDRVRWRDDGQLGYLGRADLQLKLRGYRIEPADVEQALRRVEGVRQAVVILHPTTRDRLVAFVIPEGDLTLDPEAIRDAAALELPHYMIPAEIVQLTHLPLGPTGKLDRGALAALAPVAAAPTGGVLSTPTERAVGRIWEDVLGVTGVGRDDGFLELGGHSLLAMRVAHRLRVELGVGASIRTLLTHPTVASLARELDRAAAERPPAAITRVPRVARSQPPA